MQNYKIADISLEGNFQETKKKEKKKKNNKRWAMIWTCGIMKANARSTIQLLHRWHYTYLANAKPSMESKG